MIKKAKRKGKGKRVKKKIQEIKLKGVKNVKSKGKSLTKNEEKFFLE